MDKLLYHGSDAHFKAFHLDNMGKNGTANGRGIYLTDIIEDASKYGRYLYTVKVHLESELSSTQRILSHEKLSSIIDYINQEDDGQYISNYDDISTAPYDTIKDTIIRNLIHYSDNDVDIFNDMCASSGNMSLVTEAFYDIGNYTHTIARYENGGGIPTTLIFNPDHIEIIDITTPNE